MNNFNNYGDIEEEELSDGSENDEFGTGENRFDDDDDDDVDEDIDEDDDEQADLDDSSDSDE